MEFGQGKIDFDFKKPAIKQIGGDLVTEVPGFHVINLEPKITWKKRPLPTLGPSKQHGGVVYRRVKVPPRSSKDLPSNHLEMWVPGLGFGSGGLVATGSGPVLIGVVPLGGVVISVLMCLIVLILIMSAIFWAICHLRSRHSRNTFSRPRNHEQESENWIQGAIEKDRQMSISRDVSLVNGSIQPLRTEQDLKSLMPNEAKLIMSATPSLLSNYSRSIIHSLMKSPNGSTIKDGSTASILSFTSTMVGSGTYGMLTLSQTQMRLRKNDLVVCQQNGLIFTVSEKNCPNSYLKETSEETNVCHPSKYNECVEVFLLRQETILVGKMKTSPSRCGEEPFVIQAWTVADGRLLDIGFFISCTGLCSVKDEYLVVLTNQHLSVLDVTSWTRISSTQSPFSVAKIHHGSLSIEASVDMNHIIVSELISQNLSIHFYNLDKLLERGLNCKIRTYTYNASSFTSISSSQFLVALHSNDIVLVDFIENQEITILSRCNQTIERLISSPTGELVFVQFASRMAALITNDWSNVFNVPVFSEQICTMTFSSQRNDEEYFALALDNGTIQIYDSINGQLVRTVSINLPITFLKFDEREPLLFTVSDRASHYRMNMFSLL